MWPWTRGHSGIQAASPRVILLPQLPEQRWTSVHSSLTPTCPSPPSGLQPCGCLSAGLWERETAHSLASRRVGLVSGPGPVLGLTAASAHKVPAARGCPRHLALGFGPQDVSVPEPRLLTSLQDTGVASPCGRTKKEGPGQMGTWLGPEAASGHQRRLGPRPAGPAGRVGVGRPQAPAGGRAPPSRGPAQARCSRRGARLEAQMSPRDVWEPRLGHWCPTEDCRPGRFSLGPCVHAGGRALTWAERRVTLGTLSPVLLGAEPLCFGV